MKQPFMKERTVVGAKLRAAIVAHFNTHPEDMLTVKELRLLMAHIIDELPEGAKMTDTAFYQHLRNMTLNNQIASLRNPATAPAKFFKYTENKPEPKQRIVRPAREVVLPAVATMPVQEVTLNINNTTLHVTGAVDVRVDMDVTGKFNVYMQPKGV